MLDNEGSGEPVQIRRLIRALAVRIHKLRTQGKAQTK